MAQPAPDGESQRGRERLCAGGGTGLRADLCARRAAAGAERQHGVLRGKETANSELQTEIHVRQVPGAGVPASRPDAERVPRASLPGVLQLGRTGAAVDSGSDAASGLRLWISRSQGQASRLDPRSLDNLAGCPLTHSLDDGLRFISHFLKPKADTPLTTNHRTLYLLMTVR